MLDQLFLQTCKFGISPASLKHQSHKIFYTCTLWICDHVLIACECVLSPLHDHKWGDLTHIETIHCGRQPCLSYGSVTIHMPIC